MLMESGKKVEDKIKDLEDIDKIINIDQLSTDRTPKATPQYILIYLIIFVKYLLNYLMHKYEDLILDAFHSMLKVAAAKPAEELILNGLK